METRRISYLVIALLISAVALTPLCGAALPGDEGLEHIPVQGRVLHRGDFVGTLTITAFTVCEDAQLQLTGVLNGTTTHRTGGKTQITEQTFIAPATLLDPDRTTDVLLLKLAPITLVPVGWQITLAPITLDIYALPNEGEELVTLLHKK
jgi:hypothetical protein